MLDKLNGYKTYIVAVATLVYALVHIWQVGTIDQTATDLILAGLGLGAVGHKVNRLAAKL